MKLMVMTDIYIVLKKIDDIQEILIAERDKRNELCIKYNRRVNIIGVIDNCLVVTSLNNRCCTSRNWNESSINCYGITSSCMKSSN